MYHSILDDKYSAGTVNFGEKEVKYMGGFSIVHGILGILFFTLFSPFEAADKLTAVLIFPGLMYDAPLVIMAGLGIMGMREWARKMLIYLIDLKLLIIVAAIIFVFVSHSFEKGIYYLAAIIYAPNGIIGPITFGYLLLQRSVKAVFKK